MPRPGPGWGRFQFRLRNLSCDLEPAGLPEEDQPRRPPPRKDFPTLRAPPLQLSFPKRGPGAPTAPPPNSAGAHCPVVSAAAPPPTVRHSDELCRGSVWLDPWVWDTHTNKLESSQSESRSRAHTHTHTCPDIPLKSDAPRGPLSSPNCPRPTLWPFLFSGCREGSGRPCRGGAHFSQSSPGSPE